MSMRVNGSNGWVLPLSVFVEKVLDPENLEYFKSRMGTGCIGEPLEEHEISDLLFELLPSNIPCPEVVVFGEQTEFNEDSDLSYNTIYCVWSMTDIFITKAQDWVLELDKKGGRIRHEMWSTFG